MDELPEEVLRKLSESMTELNRTMEIHSAILIKTMGNTEDLDEVLARFGKTVQKVDKIEEEILKKKQYREAYEESAAREGVNALRSFGTALMDSTQGLEKYNATLRSGFDSVADMFMSRGTSVGNAMALLTKGIGFAAEQVNEYTARVIKAYQDLAPLGLASNLTSEQIAQLGRDSGLAGDETKVFTKAIIDNKDGLAGLGSTSTNLIKNFGTLTKTSDAMRRQLDYVGSSVPEFLNFTAQYVSTQIRSGRVIRNTTETMEQLREQTFDVYKNFKVIAEVTGVSVDQQLENQKKAAANTQYQMYRLVQSDKAETLRAQARAATDKVEQDRLNARAAAIDEELNKRQELAQLLPSLMPGQEAGIFETLAQENMNIVMESNRSLMMLTKGDFGNILRDFTQGNINQAEVQSLLAQNVKQTAIELQGLAGLGTGANATLEAFGLLENTIGASMRGINNAVTAGQEGAQAAARQTQEAAAQELQARYDAATSLTTMKDSAMGVNTEFKELERNARILKDSLVSQVNPFAGAIATMAAAIVGVVGQIAVAKAILKSGPMGIPTAGGRVALPGDFGFPSTSPGGFGGGATGAATTTAGRLGGMARLGLGALSKLAVPVTALYGAYNAYQGFGADPNASFGNKLTNAGSSALNSLSFGLLGSSAEEIAARKTASANENKVDQDTELSTINQTLKDQNEKNDQQDSNENLYNTRAINYFDDIYKELLNQTTELTKLNSYGALQSGLLSGTIRPVVPGMMAGPSAKGFLGADQQEYARIPYGEKFQLPGQQTQINLPEYAGGPKAPIMGTGPATTAPDADLAPVAVPKNTTGTTGSTTGTTGAAGQTGMTSAQLAAMGLNLKPGAHKDGAPLNPKMPDLMKALQAGVPAFSRFTGINDGYARTSASKHHSGEAVDFTIRENFLNPKYKDSSNPSGKPEKDFSMAVVNAVKSAGFSTVIDEYWNPASYSTAGHFHAQLADGGRVTGPTPALIGEGRTDELVQPLLDNSILDKLSKTPAADLEIRNEYTINMQNSLKDMITSINRMGEKLSSMQEETNSKIETSNTYLRDFLKLRRA